MKHVSASQITTFRDCSRKWYFDKIVKLPRTSTAATELGSLVHEELENWLREGRAFSDSLAGHIAQSGVHLLPRDQPVHIELSLEDHLPIKDSPVKVVGFIDALYPAMSMILDHKTSSNRRYTKTERELANNVQLMLYAKAWLDHSHQERVTVTHVYYGTKGARWSHRVEATVTRDHVEKQWIGIRRTIEEMMHASQAPNAGIVNPNYQSCEKYGGCPYAGECFHADRHTPHEPTEEVNNMTPEERMKALGLDAPAPAPKPTQPFSAPEPQPSQPSQRQGTRILYVGCLPLKGARQPPVVATEHFSALIKRLCMELKVPHLGLAPYGKGWAMLAGAVSAEGWDGGALYLDPISKEYEHLITPLTELADVVIRRV